MIDKITALAADIDMTLTEKGGELPEMNIRAFNVLHEKGVLLGLATGREIVDNLKRQGRDWGLSYEFDFIIGMNGGMIYDGHNDTMWECPLMSTAEMKEILTWMMPVVDKYQVSVNVEGGGNHSAMYILGDLLEAQKRHGWYFEDRTGDIDGFCAKGAHKFLFRTDAKHEAEVRGRFMEKFSDDWQMVSTFPGTVEAFKKGIDKGHGMRRYCMMKDIDMADVIAFGDNENDNSLLEMCGWGVCLCDGAEETKQCADAVTDYGCSEGGVGRYLFDRVFGATGIF